MKKFIAVCAVLIGCALPLLSTAVRAQVAGRPPSDRYTLRFADEFDGTTLNPANWTYRSGARFIGLNRPENVSVSGGRLHIAFRKEMIDGKLQYTCGGVISKRIFGYGYYEVKSKLHRGPGLHSSFWTMGVAGDGVHIPLENTLTEIDGYEVDSVDPRNVTFNRNLYIGRRTAYGAGTSKSIDSSAEDFVAGFEWLPGKIVFYRNGVAVGQIDTKRREFYGPQNLWLSALAMSDGHPVDDSLLPSETSWDYFRYYARDLVGVNVVANANFEFIEGDAAPAPRCPVAWIDDGDTAAGFAEANPESFAGSYDLEQTAAKPYTVTTRQTLPFLMPAHYRFSARVRSSGGQSVAQMRVFDYGGVEKSIAIPKADQWTEITIPDIAVSGKNGATIAFTSTGDAGQWLRVDDVQFVQTTGRPSTDFDLSTPPIRSPFAPITVDTGIWDDNEPRAFRLGGIWYGGYGGVNRAGTQYVQVPANDTSGRFVEWIPNLPVRGNYRVSLYHLAHSGNVRDARVEVVGIGGSKQGAVDFSSDQSGWIDLGIFPFAAGRLGTVRLMPGVSAGTLRADAVRFELQSKLP
jgi:beta-glucanase (GH16 family)